MIQTVNATAHYRAGASSHQAPGAAVQTDGRTQILKSISKLQGQLRGLYQQLSEVPGDAAHIDLRLQLLRQIQAVEDQIRALQDLLKTEMANKKLAALPHAANAAAQAPAEGSETEPPSDAPTGGAYGSDGQPQQGEGMPRGAQVDVSA